MATYIAVPVIVTAKSDEQSSIPDLAETMAIMKRHPSAWSRIQDEAHSIFVPLRHWLLRQQEAATSCEPKLKPRMATRPCFVIMVARQTIKYVLTNVMQCDAINECGAIKRVWCDGTPSNQHGKSARKRRNQVLPRKRDAMFLIFPRPRVDGYLEIHHPCLLH